MRQDLEVGVSKFYQQWVLGADTSRGLYIVIWKYSMLRNGCFMVCLSITEPKSDVKLLAIEKSTDSVILKLKPSTSLMYIFVCYRLLTA